MDSMTDQVVALKAGEAWAKTRFISGSTPNLGRMIRDTKRRLVQLVSPTLMRARSRQPEAIYNVHGIHAFTNEYDVIVSAVVVRQPDF